MPGWGDLGNFVRGASRGAQRRYDKEIRDLQLKELKIKNDLLNKQQEAESNLLMMLAPQSTPSPDPNQMQSSFEGQSVAPERTVQTPGKGLMDILSDPSTTGQAQMLMLRSGMAKPKDISDLMAQASLQKFLATLGGGSNNFSPASIDVARITGDAKQLKPRDVIVRDMETPEGPKSLAFDKETLKEIGALGTPKEEKVSPEQGGRLAMLLSARKAIEETRAGITSPTGEIDYGAVASMGLNAPKTKGRVLRGKLKDAIAAKIRSETGATMTETEIEDMLERYMPSVLDSQEGIADKFSRLDEFMQNTLDVSTLPSSIRNKIKNKPSLDMGKPKVVDFNSLPK